MRNPIVGKKIENEGIFDFTKPATLHTRTVLLRTGSRDGLFVQSEAEIWGYQGNETAGPV